MGAASHRRRKGQTERGGPDHDPRQITGTADLVGDRESRRTSRKAKTSTAETKDGE